MVELAKASVSLIVCGIILLIGVNIFASADTNIPCPTSSTTTSYQLAFYSQAPDSISQPMDNLNNSTNSNGAQDSATIIGQWPGVIVDSSNNTYIGNDSLWTGKAVTKIQLWMGRNLGTETGLVHIDVFRGKVFPPEVVYEFGTINATELPHVAIAGDNGTLQLFNFTGYHVMQDNEEIGLTWTDPDNAVPSDYTTAPAIEVGYHFDTNGTPTTADDYYQNDYLTGLAGSDDPSANHFSLAGIFYETISLPGVGSMSNNCQVAKDVMWDVLQILPYGLIIIAIGMFVGGRFFQ